VIKKDVVVAWFSRKDRVSIYSTIVGSLFGLWLIGPRNALPTQIDWLNRGDFAALQLSWDFFRHTPMVQWPITALPNYGVSFDQVIGSGFGFEIILKYLSPILPNSFQYVGLWIVGCFALQGYFAAKILSIFIRESSLRFVFSLMLIASPAMVYRIHMGHPMLAAHWLILWALFLYFSSGQKTISWSALVATAIAINIYIAVMVVVIYAASVCKVSISERQNGARRRLAGRSTIPLLYGLLCFYLMGFLEYSGSTVGTGFFRLNLLSFLNPGFTERDSFSFFLNTLGSLRVRQFAAEEWEGFQYIGLGAILTIPFLGIYLVRNRSMEWLKTLLPVVVACVFLFMVALSNRVVVVRHEFDYWVPDRLLQLRQTFRAATRFGWPLYYLLTLAGVVAVYRLLKGRRALFVVSLALVTVHIIDQLPGLVYTNRQLTSQAGYESPLVDPGWEAIASTHSQVNVFPNFDLQVGEGTFDQEYWNDHWYYFARYAVDNNMSTGFGYFSRPITQYLTQSNENMLADFSSGNLERGVIYILSNRSTWEDAKAKLSPQSMALILDGYFVLAGPEAESK